jgi:flagellar hook-length control protein FliK
MTRAGPSSLGTATAGLPPAVHGGARMGAAADPRTDAPASPSPARSSAVDAPVRLRERAADVAPGAPFSELLLPAAPAPLPVATVTAGDTDDAAGTPDPAAPGQLLALLDGHWSTAGTVAAVPPATPAITDAASAPVAIVLPPLGHRGPVDGADAATGATGASDGTEAALARTAGAAVAGRGGTFAMPAGDAPTAPTTPLVETLASVPAAGDDAGNGFATEGSPAVAATQAAPLAATRHAAPALPPLPVPAHAASGFDDGFGDRIAWMVDQRVGHAEIRLNPEHLGPIDVRVQLDGDIVRAGFHSAHAEVLQAIEATLPRLRELLGQHGLQLGQADVGQRYAGQEGAPGRAGSPASSGEADADTSGPAPAPVRPRGLVDMYA